MATRLQKVPCRNWLHRKRKLLKNSVILKDIVLKLKLKLSMETNFGPLKSKSNLKLDFDVIVMFFTFLSFRPFQ